MAAACAQRQPAGAEPDSVPEAGAGAAFPSAVPLLEEAAGAHVGGLGPGSPAGWCTFLGELVLVAVIVGDHVAAARRRRRGGTLSARAARGDEVVVIVSS
jgi:hypothetical protein